MRKKISIDGRPIRLPYSGVAQYTGRLFAHLNKGKYDCELVTPTYRETQRFFLEAKLGDGILLRKALLPRKSWSLAMRYLPFGGRALPEFRNTDLVHLTHFEVFPKNLPRSVTKALTVHDMVFLEHPEWFTKRNLHASVISCDQMLKGGVDLVLTPSTYTRDKVLEFGYKGPIFVTPLAATASTNDPIEEALGIPNLFTEKPFALFLGNLEPRKGVEDLIEAWSLSESSTDARLIIIGRSAYLSAKIELAIKIAQSRGVDIVHLGFVTEEFKSMALRMARLMVYPSYDEGFGIPILDAMSVGLPVITTTAGSIPEVAGGAATLIQPGNVEELSYEIDRVFNDQQKLLSYSKLGLERSKIFTWEQTSLLTEKAYGQAFSDL